MRRSRRVLVGLLGALCTASCAELPYIDEVQCGNGFIEPNEDCDEPEDPTATAPRCHPPGSPDECRIRCDWPSDCVKVAQGQDLGWGCGTDHVCRRPKPCSSASYFDPCRKFDKSAVVPENATTLLVADFDGTGRQSLLSVASPIVSVHYFDDEGLLVDSNSLVVPDASPAVGDLTSDDAGAEQHVAAAFTLDVSSGLSVIRGASDQTLQPTVYASVSVPGTAAIVPVVRPVPADPLTFERTTPTLLYLPKEVEGTTAFAFAPGAGPMPAPTKFPLEGSGKIAGNVVTANFKPLPSDDCVYFAVAFTGENDVNIYFYCAADAPVFSKEASIKLAGDAKICSECQALHVVDLNGDSAPDLVISGVTTDNTNANAIFTAYNLKNGHFSSAPGGPADDVASLYPVTFTDIGESSDLAAASVDEPPLAVGDLNKDCAFDFVNRFGTYLSYFDGSAPVDCTKPQGYFTTSSLEDEHGWTSASIADMSGDGYLDVAVGSKDRPGITFYRNTGLYLWNPVKLATSGGVKNFAVGDFDGNSVLDLAFAQVDDIDKGNLGRESLLIAFGTTNDYLSQPKLMGQTGPIQQILTSQVPAVSPDLTTDLFVVSQNQDNGGTDIALFPGNSTRQVLAPYYLIGSPNLPPDRPKQSTIGQFTGDQHNDIAAFGWELCPGDAACHVRLWLMPSTGEAGLTPTGKAGAPVETDIVFGDSAVYTQALQDGVLLATVDLDAKPSAGVRMDEVVLVAGGAPPSLLVARVANDHFEWQGTPIPLDDLAGGMDEGHIRYMQIVIADVDGDEDRTPDVVVSSRRGVLVLWNRAKGSLSRDDATFLPRSELPEDPCPEKACASVRGVAALNVNATPAKELAIVTGAATYVRRYEKGQFVPAAPTITGAGVSVAAGDMNGDGVDDIAIGRQGGIDLFIGQAAPAGADKLLGGGP